MNDLFGQDVDDRTLPGGTKTTKANGYARRPGSGPAGKTCGDCAHCSRVRCGARVYLKCGVIRHRWTHGPGTDIKKKSPACEMFREDI